MHRVKVDPLYFKITSITSNKFILSDSDDVRKTHDGNHGAWKKRKKKEVRFYIFNFMKLGEGGMKIHRK